MRRPSLPGLVAALAALGLLGAVGFRNAAVLGDGEHSHDGDVRTVTTCPAEPAVPAPAPVHLVADLDHVQVRDSASRPALLAAADQVLGGGIPVVRPRPDDGGDPVRYLYDEGVALRRVVGVLGYAYAVTHDPRYLDALAAQTVRAARWPDWNPNHPLDTAQIGTGVALGLAWSRSRMTAAERQEVVTALGGRLVTPYVCGAGPADREQADRGQADREQGLAARRTGDGNQVTVVGVAVVLAGLAAGPDDPGWAGAAVRAGTDALARHSAPDGSGRSIADGPTVEGLMYTTYEAANVALLTATLGANQVPGGGPTAVQPLVGAVPSLDALALWNERCGRVADPAVQDGWDRYPWVDRTTALAAMAGSPRSGPRVQGLIEALQAQAEITVPGAGRWMVPDGIAELVLSQVTPGTAGTPPSPPAQVHVAGGPDDARQYGCSTYGDTYALVTAVPNDAPHAHTDIGNLVVKQGEQTVLDDLGQRDYSFTGQPVWRGSTKAHSTLGALQPDGTVLQRHSGSGAVAADGADLVMTSTTALPGVASWQRRVSVGDGTVRVRDALATTGGAPVPLSASFLLATPPSAVAQQPDGSLRVTVGDGSVWQLVPPAGTAVTYSDASPAPPYVDAPGIAGPAAAHTLVVVRADVAGSADLVTELHRVG